MKKQKAEISAEQIYRQNKKKAKVFQRLAPIIRIVFLVLAVVFFWQMIENSVGNVIEINNLLDKEIYNAAELQENYEYLVDKWGEWETGAMSGGVKITYVNVMKAMFSGLMKLFMIFSITSLLISVLFGKIVFPLMAKIFTEQNDTLIDLATINTMEQVNEMSGKKERNKRKKEDWF